jgi:hypothetical protein
MIDWSKTGIPTTTKSKVNQGGFQTDLGPGPQGNMMGSSVHSSANSAIDAAYKSAGPDAVVQTRPKFEPIEAVEGFGTPDKEKYVGALGSTNEAS